MQGDYRIDNQEIIERKKIYNLQRRSDIYQHVHAVLIFAIDF